MRDHRSDPRSAGEVSRWHTWPMLRGGTVAAHSWHVARIMLAIHPSASREALVEAIFHDIGEIVTGDPPYPVKADNPVFGTEAKRIEGEARLKMASPWGVPAPSQGLSNFDRWLVKLADIVEMWEHAREEMFMGNKNAIIVEARASMLAKDHMRKCPSPVDETEIAERLDRYMSRRESVTNG